MSETKSAEDVEYRLPEGSLLKIEATVRLPAAATEAEITDWLESNIANLGGIDDDNPLLSEGVEVFGHALEWRDTGEQGREVKFDHEDLGEGRSQYKVRYERTRR